MSNLSFSLGQSYAASARRRSGVGSLHNVDALIKPPERRSKHGWLYLVLGAALAGAAFYAFPDMASSLARHIRMFR
jgi:hypothetical protein